MMLYYAHGGGRERERPRVSHILLGSHCTFNEGWGTVAGEKPRQTPRAKRNRQMESNEGTTKFPNES